MQELVHWLCLSLPRMIVFHYGHDLFPRVRIHCCSQCTLLLLLSVSHQIYSGQLASLELILGLNFEWVHLCHSLPAYPQGDVVFQRKRMFHWSLLAHSGLVVPSLLVVSFLVWNTLGQICFFFLDCLRFWPS